MRHIPAEALPGTSDALRLALGEVCDCADALRDRVTWASVVDADKIKRAFEFVTEAQATLLGEPTQRDEMIEVLRAARGYVADDRELILDASTVDDDPAILDDIDAAVIRDIDGLLARIDAAIGGST